MEIAIDTKKISAGDRDVLARALRDKVLEFFDDEKNLVAFEKWKAERENGA